MKALLVIIMSLCLHVTYTSVRDNELYLKAL